MNVRWFWTFSVVLNQILAGLQITEEHSSCNNGNGKRTKRSLFLENGVKIEGEKQHGHVSIHE